MVGFATVERAKQGGIGRGSKQQGGSGAGGRLEERSESRPTLASRLHPAARPHRRSAPNRNASTNLLATRSSDRTAALHPARSQRPTEKEKSGVIRRSSETEKKREKKKTS